jgi:hypothetical protein
MANQETCRLCGGNGALRQSHIIPSFVFARQKDASSTAYLRCGQNPNLRQQDGLKLPFLCGRCEDRLNQWETSFANTLFHPFHERRSPPFEYGPWLAKCSASILWRVLTYLTELDSADVLSADLGAEVRQALGIWKAFLLTQRPDVGPYELHLIPLDTIQETTQNHWPKKINRYFVCVSEFDMLHSARTVVAFAKMLRLVLIGFVREPDAAFWQGARIELSGGRIAPCQLHLPDWLGAHFRQRAERLAYLESSLSEKQKGKIKTVQVTERRRVLKSETMRAFLADRCLAQMKGDHA